jgi:Flp pilus assembly protein TadD
MNAGDETPLQPSISSAAAIESVVWFGNLDQPQFDVQFYERVLERQPNDIRILKLLGELYARQGRHDRSLEIDRRLVNLLPRDGTVHYNLACSLAMVGNSQEAVAALAHALELGYNDFGQLEVDPELDGVRGRPEFQTLLRRFGGGD